MLLSYPDIQLIRPPAVESFRFATTSITLSIGLAYISSSLKEYGFKNLSIHKSQSLRESKTVSKY